MYKFLPAIALLLLASGCRLVDDLLAPVPFPSNGPSALVATRSVEYVVHDPPYVPQQLEQAAASELFSAHADRAFERWRNITGRTGAPPTLFGKVAAAADYVATLAKHPHRHILNHEHGDPRADELLTNPAAMARLAEENQVWNGEEWVAAPGKTLEDVPAILCTQQHLILGGIVNAIGAQWRFIVIRSHTAFAYYDFELAKWIYIESTFNEHYRYRDGVGPHGDPLSPKELRALSRKGRTDKIIVVRHPYQPQRVEPESLYYVVPYVEREPEGWAPMAVTLDGRVVDRHEWLGYDIQVLPGNRSETYFAELIQQGWPVSDSRTTIWTPQGETFLDSLGTSGGGVNVQLSTNLAAEDPVYERSFDGQRWQPVGQVDGFEARKGLTVRYRARSGPFVSGMVVLEVKPASQCRVSTNCVLITVGDARQSPAS